MITAARGTLEEILSRYSGEPRFLIEVLQDIQEAEGYVSEDSMRTVSDRLGVPLIEVYRVVNFYRTFSLQPRGRHVLL